MMFLIINGMHGLISHVNVDVRMGWADFLFIGPKQHHYHHSGDVREVKIYGATLAIYDLLFGTYIYRPGVPTRELGVSAASGLTAYNRYFQVLALPFARSDR